MDRSKLLTVFGVAWLSAALLTWFLYAKTKAPKTEETVKVVAASRDMSSGTKVGKNDIRMVTVLKKDLPKAALTKPEEVIGRALLYPISANEPISGPRLSTLTGAEGVASVIQPGMRAVSVPFTDATGVGGLIQPRAHVDVMFTRTSGASNEAMTVALFENVEVLSVGRNIESQASTGVGAAKNVARSQNQTATLMITPEQAKKLELAKNQGKIALVLRNPLDESTEKNADPATLHEINPALAYAATPKKGRKMPSNLRDKAWAQLIGEDPPPPPKQPKEPKKDPPKPKHVVDVYRGERHVQEIFQ